MKVHAGLLKRNIILKQPTATRNTEGAKVKVFSEVTQARAAIKQSNRFVAGQIEPVLLNTDDVVFRYSTIRAGITKDWVINYGGKDHLIHSIEFLGAERNEFIKVVCKANE